MPGSNTLIKRDSDFISYNMHKVALIRAMRLHGLTATKVIKPIVEALSASKVISAVNSGDANGATTDFIDVPDHATRLRAAALAIQLLELTKDTKEQQNKTNKLIKESIKKGDEVELQRIVFNKGK